MGKKTPEADKLLDNMQDELKAALGQSSRLIGLDALPVGLNAAQRHTALGYQAKGLEFVKGQAKGLDLSPMLVAPTVVHGKPRSLANGTHFELLKDPADVAKRLQVTFCGFGK